MGVRVVGVACVGLWATVAAAAGDEVAPAERLRAHVEFLAGDALRGRASGSAEERIAAEYAAAMLRAAGLQGAATTGGFVESVELVRQPFAGAPFVEAGGHRFEHGPAAAFYRLSAPPVEGPLVRLRPGAAADEVAGKVVLATLDPAAGRAGLGVLFELLEGGAAAVLVTDAPAVAAETIDEGSSLRGHLAIPAGAPFFTDHFPRKPVFPATLLMDALGNAAARMAGDRHRVVGMQDVKVRVFMPPGATLAVAVDVDRDDPLSARVVAKMDGRPAATARVRLERDR